ncbi:MAG: 50S ribosomal protein L31 [Rhizobacter sp.]|nr:50S ribosomal protein L31 [Chlorobiales bacterium]
MKENIHPVYLTATATCANCGNVFKTRSTAPTLKVDICSNCHPFFSGKQVLVDTAGRVDRFNKRFAKKEKSAEQTVDQAAEQTATPVENA